MYWISYSFFVLHKPITEINAANYIGSIATLAFIWAGTQILKPHQVKAKSQQPKLQAQTPQQKPRQNTIQQNMPQQPAPANSACAHYLGYLHQRQASQ
jgi:hypothetical protein